MIMRAKGSSRTKLNTNLLSIWQVAPTQRACRHLNPNNYALYVTLLLFHPHVYCIKSHGTGKEEALAVPAVQVFDIG
jgi:hypothetical protein